MLEQELKFAVSASLRKELVQALVRAGGDSRVHLRAMYFDTPDRQLARQKAAIRLRLEGRKWVQTFKMAGANAMTRIELNHPCPRRTLDLSVYAGTPAEAVLQDVQDELAVRYETDVWRRRASIRTRWGSVEIAHDEGEIRAGELTLPIHELEFELLSGQPRAVFSAASRWLRQYGLVLDLRSKAERGDALAEAALRIGRAAPEQQQAARRAEIARFWSARNAANVKLPHRVGVTQAKQAVTDDCFEQIARNAALLAAADMPDGERPDGSEPLHQLRVGMRRLRSLWLLLEGRAELPPAGLRQAAREYFGEFGRIRDQDVIGETVLPSLLAAGMPPLPGPAREQRDAAGLAAGAEFQTWLLQLLAWNLGLRDAPSPSATAQEPAEAPPQGEARRLAGAVTPRLDGWHKRLVRDGARFAGLDDERRHTLRKLAKRLRYGLALAGTLYSARRIRRYRKALAALQDVLGEMNDLVMARAHYATLTEAYPQAWFALGWIAARLRELEEQAGSAFARLGETRRPWK
ncbi:CHAD domain protein [Pigmentiphaga humi]|uniref:CHAD domain protein n=1 Tax=Pigmentiphaga humi TaxID=2478468 RepID=A0A3P4AXC6_9BURK|nr:CYTH and CHAD domain-containing protein [Pigmentiphaga humi]VCU68724.1 CHAD domain protein [Pigmentiphaga humi]